MKKKKKHKGMELKYEEFIDVSWLLPFDVINATC